MKKKKLDPKTKKIFFNYQFKIEECWFNKMYLFNIKNVLNYY